MPDLKFNAYLQAMFADAGNGQPFELPTRQKEEVAGHIVELSLWREYCREQTIGEIGESSIKILKNIGGTLKNKVVIGDGEMEKMSFPSVTLTFYKPLYISQALGAADITMGVPDAVAFKSRKFFDQFSKNHEFYAFGKAEATVKSNAEKQESSFDFNKATPQEIWARIVQEGTKASLLIDPAEGIDLVGREPILISIEPNAFDKLSLSGLIGNRVDKTFAGGQYSIGSIGGYSVMANPFLKDYKVLVGTVWAGGNGIKVIAQNVGRIGLSSDIGCYFEATGVAGVVYPTVFFGIKQVDTPTVDPADLEQYNAKLDEIEDQNKSFISTINKLEEENKITKEQLEETLLKMDTLRKQANKLEQTMKASSEQQISNSDKEISENDNEMLENDQKNQLSNENEEKDKNKQNNKPNKNN